MDNNWKILTEELHKYQNTLVITQSGIVMVFLNIVDGFDDYYYDYGHKDKVHRDSCVGEFIPLKGFIPDETYRRLLRTWNLNNKFKAV